MRCKLHNTEACCALTAGAEQRSDASAEAAPQQGAAGGWAEGSAEGGGAPGAQDTSAWGTPGWMTAPAAPVSGGNAWDLDPPTDLPTTGKWDEWNEFMYADAAGEPPAEAAAQLLPGQALPGDDDLFNFRDEMVTVFPYGVPAEYTLLFCDACYPAAV